MTLVVAGVGLLIRRTIRIAAVASGSVLLVLTVFFYGSILVTELRAMESNPGLLVEGLNYVFDTMLFAATVLLAGRGLDLKRASLPVVELLQVTSR